MSSVAPAGAVVAAGAARLRAAGAGVTGFATGGLIGLAPETGGASLFAIPTTVIGFGASLLAGYQGVKNIAGCV